MSSVFVTELIFILLAVLIWLANNIFTLRIVYFVCFADETEAGLYVHTAERFR